MFFCPECNNTLQIAQGIEQMVINNDTPKTVSSSEPGETIETGTTMSPESSNKAYFRCTNCEYNAEIAEGTLIVSRTSEHTSKDRSIDPHKYRDMIYDMTLPRTRNYTCPNSTCESHKNASIRESVWFKPTAGDYSTITICTACETMW